MVGSDLLHDRARELGRRGKQVRGRGGAGGKLGLNGLEHQVCGRFRGYLVGPDECARLLGTGCKVVVHRES